MEEKKYSKLREEVIRDSADCLADDEIDDDFDRNITRKVNLAVEEALLEHKRKNVPYVILGSNGIIYEVYSDGTRVPVDKIEEVHYAQRVNS